MTRAHNPQLCLVDRRGNPIVLPRAPSVECVARCIDYIAWVESHGKGEKMPTRYDAPDTHTRLQTWKRTAYALKHDVEEWSPITKKFDSYQGYVAAEDFAMAAVLCGVEIKHARFHTAFDCEFIAPKQSGGVS